MSHAKNNNSNKNETAEVITDALKPEAIVIVGEVVNEEKTDFEALHTDPIPAAVKEKPLHNPNDNPFKKEESMNTAKETDGKLAKAVEAKYGDVNIMSVVAAGGIAAIGISAQLIVTNVLKDQAEVEGSRYTGLQIAGRAVAGAALSSGLCFGAQKLSSACASDPSINMLTTAMIGNGVRVADAFFGDAVMNMFSAGVSATTNKVNSLFADEEAVEEVTE